MEKILPLFRILNDGPIGTFIMNFSKNAISTDKSIVWVLTFSNEIIELSDMEEFKNRENLTTDGLAVVAISKKSQEEGPFSQLFDLRDIAAVLGQGSYVFAIGSVLVGWGTGKYLLSFRFKECCLKELRNLNIRPYKQLSKKISSIFSSDKKHKHFMWKLTTCNDLNGAIRIYEKSLPWLDFHVTTIDNA